MFILKDRKNKLKVKEGFLPTGTINSKAALLSGDPGLGKTTTARLLGIELNFNIVEFNASDIRNKKGVQSL
jgi:replication factor C subunit 1